MNKDYDFEEREEFVEDCEKPFKAVRRDRVDEYWNIFADLLHSIGSGKQYRGLVQNFGKGQERVDAVVNQQAEENLMGITAVIDAYSQKQQDGENRAERRLIKFINLCQEIEISFPYEFNDYFDSLLDPDKRKCHYETIEYGRKHRIILSPEEIESRYAKRLRKRAQKKNNNKK